MNADSIKVQKEILFNAAWWIYGFFQNRNWELNLTQSFSSHNRNFIRNYYYDGKIEITLPWTDKGLGLVIQSTGRNRRETEKIANLLEEKYSK